MKKIVFTLMFLSAFVFLNAWNGHYTIPCPRCKELTLTVQKGYSYCLGCPMWRCYTEECSESNKGYMVYRCPHGHKILIPKNSDSRTNDLNEVLVEDRNGNRTQLDTVK